MIIVEAILHLSGALLFGCILGIPRINEVFFWLFISLCGFVGVMEVWTYLASI